MKKREKEQNGITLIALVVTIIVLLVLAGVAISMLSGENGILNQAVKAKEATARSQALEAAQLAYMSSQMVNQDKDENTIISKAIEDLTTKQGYTVYTDRLEATTIKNIKYMLNDVDKTKEGIKINKGNGIDVALITEIETTNNDEYYIQINKKYYLLTMNSEEVSIGDTEADINNLENNDGESITEVTSNNTAIVTATLNDAKTNIIITGVSAGETTITTKTNLGQTESLKVTVTDLVLAESISLNYTEKELTRGERLQLVATISPSNTTDKTITWSSSNTSIATVDSNGLVTASSTNTGTAIISAETSNGKKATVNINVVETKLISFIIRSWSGSDEAETYQAEEGMTWGDWVKNSDYNTCNLSIVNCQSGIKHISMFDGIRSVYEGKGTTSLVTENEVIQANGDYFISSCITCGDF